MNAHEVVVVSGLDEGAVVARNVAVARRRDEPLLPGCCAAARNVVAAHRSWSSPSLAGAFATARSSSAPDLPTAEVKKGEFVDTLEIRGDIRPLKSIVLSSPMQSGELQIVKLAKNGSMVKAGRRRRRSSTARRCSGRCRRSSRS